jgi:hypothetical protein
MDGGGDDPTQYHAARDVGEVPRPECDRAGRGDAHDDLADAAHRATHVGARGLGDRSQNRESSRRKATDPCTVDCCLQRGVDPAVAQPGVVRDAG